jgi:hypothetical protein
MHIAYWTVSAKNIATHEWKKLKFMHIAYWTARTIEKKSSLKDANTS